ncbi:glycosyltransferase family 2 protein, partial [Mailhella sp.]|uniref:glycosyltransferase family 2 protein n=1 Tax=Mailhella sp. TaxID=1981029 RepID=UPI00406423C5
MDSLMLTIIVPCYNAEKYIDRCLSSIYNQTYKNFECIVIDDGSTDNSATLCDKFSAKDSRFIIIHQENRGVSAARNAALDIARGEYIGFVDADDYIDVDHFELMLASAEKFKTDLVLCDVIAERNRQALWVSSYISEKDVLTKSEFMLDLLND